MAATQSQLLEALQALYHSADPTVKSQANEWLEGWQKSSGAWQLADAVLHAEGSSMEAQWFCAQTLRTKVQRDLEELPPQAVTSLRDSVFTLLVRFSRGAPPVRSQLTLAMIALIAHVPFHDWSLQGPVGWLVEALQPQPKDVALPCLLEILKELPPECISSRIAVRPERRRQLREELVRTAPLVHSILASTLQEPALKAATADTAMEAFAEWLWFTGRPGLGVLHAETLCSHPLVVRAVEGLSTVDAFHTSVEAVSALIWATLEGERVIQPDMAPLVQLLVGAVLQLRERFAVAAARAREEEGLEPHHRPVGAPAHDDDDEDTTKGMARLFVEVGEAYVDFISGGSEAALAPVEAVLDVGGFPDEAIAALSFRFWDALTERLTGPDSAVRGSDGLPPPPITQEQRDARIATFAPVYQRLVLAIQARVQLPSDLEDRTPEGQRDFERSRRAIADTLVDAGYILGGDVLLQLLTAPLRQLSEAAAAGGALDWQRAEAALFCIGQAHRVGISPSSDLMLMVFAALPQLPPAPRLTDTACLLVYAHAPWLGEALLLHPDSVPNSLLGPLVGFLCGALAVPEAAREAAAALREVAGVGGAHMTPFRAGLLGLLPDALRSGACHSPASGVKLSEESVQLLLQAAARVGRNLPAGEQRGAVAGMLAPIVQELDAALATAAAGGPGASAALVVDHVDRLAAVLSEVRDAQAVVSDFASLWPRVEAALQHCTGDVRGLEHICRLIRLPIRLAGTGVAPLVPALAASIPGRFAATRHSAFLYIVAQLVKVFGPAAGEGPPEVAPLVEQVLQAACAALTTPESFDAQPELVDDVYILAGRVLTYDKPLFWGRLHLVEALLARALVGLHVQHRDACCSILAFLLRLCDAVGPAEAGVQSALQTALAPRLGGMLKGLLAGIVGALPTNRISDLSDTLFSVVRMASQTGVDLVVSTVGLLPDAVASPEEKDAFIEKIYAAAHSTLPRNRVTRELESAVIELCELCRRTPRVQAAAQAALHPYL